MNLHHVGKRPDWQLVPPGKRNAWQRIAARTGGVVTAANALSVAGAASSMWGVVHIANHQLFLGLAAISIGRIADAFDGAVADITGTKSPLGEALDATLDKLLLLAILIVSALTNLAPLWALAGITAVSLLVGCLGLTAKLRKQELHPDIFGKLSTAGLWITLVLYGITALVQVPWLTIIANAGMIVSLVLGLFALINYTQTALGKRTDHSQPSQALPAFKQIIIVQNAVSTNASSAKKYIAELQKLLPEVPCKIITTTPHSINNMGILLMPVADRLGPDTLLGVAGGDGTHRSVIEYLLTAGNLPARARKTPVLPLWAGSGNDMATMLNGPGEKSTLQHTFANGRIVSVYPLECIMRLKRKGRWVRLAANSASFGASANVARRLDEPNRRQSWLNNVPGGRAVQDYTTGLLAWFEARPFTLMEDGASHSIYDRIFANGWRACTFNIAPVGLTERAFYFVNHPRNRIIGLLIHFFDTIDPRRSKHARSKPVRFTVSTPTWAQFDGEPMQLPAHTKVTVKLSRQPFYAVSTKFGQH
ncbi:MAG TPA: CDP-alcohol phosphatidyltransferase family protein [Candidatus Acidoferrum sp.]|nr:CDP-alcohol phosphatidyltransferase family protein [Candidatus Acidoferrum sp.]